ncbi:hypothetical protein K490DRAFT_64534 [Saccharata proteae CBS 121410]|uniref:CwfJ domain-containing protein n=1 Tax=Saccharata proteae CBS 121410 TaxID=1314787 RepID=A0A9P4LY68_9PEZI|nr:hypothetical protein K490DRAFT_64534 [Saccharata proteae CBS 121410]
MASKIVVVGDVNGQFPTVFGKISALHSKNAFSFALITGDLFANPAIATDEDQKNVEDLLSGKIELPLPVYFGLGQHGLPENVIQKLESSDGEVCSNLYFLGKRTTMKTSEGIRIVALGGALNRNIMGISKDKYPPYYSEDDARSLRGANTTDILLTSQWPSGIQTGSKVQLQSEGDATMQQQCVSDLCASLKPRYHFSTSPDAFYEREPFFHPPSEKTEGYHITRFISLAAFGNSKKQKWIYAFSIDPSATPPVAIPAGTMASPLAAIGQKRPLPSQASSYRFSTDDRHQRRSNKRQRAPPPTPDQCFFCLSNPNLATHLITSIGTDAYLTTAKGPLSTATTYAPALKFPCHILIIPLTHSPTLATIDDAESRKSTYNEMQRYRHSLQSMLSNIGKNEIGAVTWEVSRAGGIHTHWQFLPVPADLIRRGLVEAAFKVEAENEKYPKFEKKDVGDGFEEGNDFFRLMIWSPPKVDDATEKETNLVLPLDYSSFRFDLQFGRRVLAKLLGLENRMHWQECGQTHEDEVGDAEAFKSAFKAFDFSLDE